MINEFKDLNSFKDEMKGWLKHDNNDGPCCCGAWHKPDTPPLDQVVEEVRQDLLNRSEVGIKKYGVTLDRKDLGLKEWLTEAYCEALDFCLYLKRSIKEIDGQTGDNLRNTK